MAKIEGFRIHHFRTECDVTLCRLWDTEGTGKLTPKTAVIGKNRSVKVRLLKM